MDKIVINVCGKKFITLRKHLKNFPDTRLGKLTRKSESYDPHIDEHFFDRNPKLVPSVLDLYRTGELHLPASLCSNSVKSELRFWQISEDLICEACWKRYASGKEDEMIVQTIDRTITPIPEFSFEDSLKKRISLTLEFPSYSGFATVWNVLNMSMAFGLTMAVMMGTIERWRVGRPGLHAGNKTVTQLDILLTTSPAPWLNYIEIICLSFLSLDMLARFFTCSSKKKFAKDWLNVVDFLINWIMWLAFLLDFVGNYLGHSLRLTITHQVLKALFCLNIFRLFHFVRHYAMMKILLLTFKASFSQLLLLCVALTIVVVIYATSIYFAEILTSSDTFHGMPTAIWWTLITMTTVGYGDFVPHSLPGYIIGAVCSLSGVLFLAMPVAIIASNFTSIHGNMTARDQRKRRQSFLRKTAHSNANCRITNPDELGGKSLGTGSHVMGANRSSRDNIITVFSCEDISLGISELTEVKIE